MLCAPLDGSTMLCSREGFCGSKTLWRRVANAIWETLRTTTLADLAPDVPPAHVQMGPASVRLPMAQALPLQAETATPAR